MNGFKVYIFKRVNMWGKLEILTINFNTHTYLCRGVSSSISSLIGTNREYQQQNQQQTREKSIPSFEHASPLDGFKIFSLSNLFFVKISSELPHNWRKKQVYQGNSKDEAVSVWRVEEQLCEPFGLPILNWVAGKRKGKRKDSIWWGRL